jgi:hypothetical protein
VDEVCHEFEMNELKTATNQEMRVQSFIRIEKFDYENNRYDIDSDYDVDDIADEKLRMPTIPFSFLIIDCSPINFIDTVGVKTMKQVKLCT